jgi:hypothetical protein
MLCVYLKEEWKDGKVVKICTIQHKGTTLMEIHKVSKSAIYLRRFNFILSWYTSIGFLYASVSWNLLWL